MAAQRPPAGSFCSGRQWLIPWAVSALMSLPEWILLITPLSHGQFLCSFPGCSHLLFFPPPTPGPAFPLTALHPQLLSSLILSFLPSSAHRSANSSCFSQPQTSFSLSTTLLSLHLNQLLSLSFVNTRQRMRGRKRSLKRR